MTNAGFETYATYCLFAIGVYTWGSCILSDHSSQGLQPTWTPSLTWGGLGLLAGAEGAIQRLSLPSASFLTASLQDMGPNACSPDSFPAQSEVSTGSTCLGHPSGEVHAVVCFSCQKLFPASPTPIPKVAVSDSIARGPGPLLLMIREDLQVKKASGEGKAIDYLRKERSSRGLNGSMRRAVQI